MRLSVSECSFIYNVTCLTLYTYEPHTEQFSRHIFSSSTCKNIDMRKEHSKLGIHFANLTRYFHIFSYKKSRGKFVHEKERKLKPTIY